MTTDNLYAGNAGDGAGDDAQALAAAEAAAGNADGQVDIGALQAEVERLRGVQMQALAEKSTLESLKRQNAELLARQHAPANAYGGQGALAGGITPQMLQARLAQLDAVAKNAAPGDPSAVDAALVSGLYGFVEDQARQLREMRDLLPVPVDQHEQVRQYQQAAAQRGEVLSAATARKLIELEAQGAQGATLSQREEALRQQEDARKRGVVRTGTVPAMNGGSGPQTLSMDEWSARYDKLTPAQQMEFNAKSRPGPDGKMVVGA